MRGWDISSHVPREKKWVILTRGWDISRYCGHQPRYFKAKIGSLSFHYQVDFVLQPNHTLITVFSHHKIEN